MQRPLVAAIAEIINEKHAYSWNGEKRLPRPLLNQVRWNHGERRGLLPLAVCVDGSKRDQGLAGSALRNNECRSGLLPAFDHSHDGDALGRKRLSQELSQARRHRFVELVKRRKFPENAFAE